MHQNVALPRCHSICGKQRAAEYTQKLRHLNPAARQNPAVNQLTTNALQDFQQLYPRFRCQQGLERSGMQMCLGGTSEGVLPKGPTEQPKHLNLNKTRENHRNTLKNFILRGLNKHFSWFRCGGKGKHLNLALRQNQAVNPLTTNALQERFRSQTGLEGNRLQMCPGGASGWGTPERANRTAQASEPERNSKKSLQHIEKLSIARLQQTHPLVQMRRQREASAPCGH